MIHSEASIWLMRPANPSIGRRKVGKIGPHRSLATFCMNFAFDRKASESLAGRDPLGERITDRLRADSSAQTGRHMVVGRRLGRGEVKRATWPRASQEPSFHYYYLPALIWTSGGAGP